MIISVLICVTSLVPIIGATIGVIIGADLRYEDGHIVTDYTKRAKTIAVAKKYRKTLRKYRRVENVYTENYSVP